MRRRRLLLLAVAAIAGTVLVVRGGAADDPPVVESPAGQQPPAVAHVPPEDSPTASPAAEVDPATPDEDSPAQPEAVTAAERFARAWVDPGPQWSDRLAEIATADLTASLADVDATVVPARTVTGPGSVLTEVPGWVSVAVPTNTGTVVLHVVAAADGWLVSAIDWRPER